MGTRVPAVKRPIPVKDNPYRNPPPDPVEDTPVEPKLPEPITIPTIVPTKRPGIKRELPKPKLQPLSLWSTAVAVFAKTLENALSILPYAVIGAVIVWAVRGALIAARSTPWGAAASTAVFLIFLLVKDKPAQAAGATKADLKTVLGKEQKRYESSSHLPTKMNALRHLWLIMQQAQNEMSIVLDTATEKAAGELKIATTSKQTEIIQKFVEVYKTYAVAAREGVKKQNDVIQLANALTEEIKQLHGNNPQWINWLRYYQNCFAYFKQTTLSSQLTFKEYNFDSNDIRAILESY